MEHNGTSFLTIRLMSSGNSSLKNTRFVTRGYHQNIRGLGRIWRRQKWRPVLDLASAEMGTSTITQTMKSLLHMWKPFGCEHTKELRFHILA